MKTEPSKKEDILIPPVTNNLKAKRIFSFIIGAIVTFSLFSGLTQGIKLALKKVFNITYGFWDVLGWSTLAITIILGGAFLGKIIRSSSKQVQIVGGFSIPNPVYDKYFEVVEKSNKQEIIDENTRLKALAAEQKDLNNDLAIVVQENTNDIETLSQIIDIYNRHGKNASRLIRWLLQLMREGNPDWKKEFCKNVLDECTTVMTNGSADKSASLFYTDAYDTLLSIFAYHRIEYGSTREKVFAKGEGFAGNVWSKNRIISIGDVAESEWFEGRTHFDHYGSILGAPVYFGKEIKGVICIQSEKVDGFAPEDEVTLRFYADLCALAHYCDTIMKKEVIKNEHDTSKTENEND